MSTQLSYDLEAWGRARQRAHDDSVVCFARFILRHQAFNAALRSGDRAHADKLLDEQRQANLEEQRQALAANGNGGGK